MKQEIATVGLDLAKSVFQVHVIGSDGAVLIRRKLLRAEVIGFFTDLPSCLFGMEACCIGPSLGSRADRTGARGPADAAYLCKALRKARED